MNVDQQLNLAYLAGYFDRSACFTATNTYFPTLVVSSVGKPVLEILQQRLTDAGLPPGRIKTFHEGKHRRERYHLIIDGMENVETLLNALYPYLVVRKTEAHLLLNLIGLGRLPTNKRVQFQRSDLFSRLREQKKKRGTLRQRSAAVQAPAE